MMHLINFIIYTRKKLKLFFLKNIAIVQKTNFLNLNSYNLNCEKPLIKFCDNFHPVKLSRSLYVRLLFYRCI